MNKYVGIYPALVTPFKDDGTINETVLKRLIEVNLSKGVAGFYVGGSTGESYLLTFEERKQIMRMTVEAVAGRADVIANIGVFSTDDGIRLARYAEDVGASVISSVPPFYFKFDIDEYVDYYIEIADAVSIPIIIYNVPTMSNVNFTSYDIGRFFLHDNIIGMKHTSYNLFQMQRIMEAYPDKSIFIGHDELFLPAYSVGARAAIGSTFNFMAEKFILIEELIKKGELEKALIIQAEVNAVVEVLVSVGVFKGIKAALGMQGINCGECRRPFKPLLETEKKSLREILIKTGCL